MTPTREARSELRRWCPIAELHQDADEVECNGNYCTDNPTHNLRLRRMLVCSVCEQAYFKGADFADHECWSAY